jgi:hypothetical protein
MRTSLVLALCACGGGNPPPEAPARVGPAAALVAPPAGPDDLEVAKVAGKPVWGSCVATQIRRGAKDRTTALRECIDFELLAQAADARGLATRPDVIEATRTAIVNRIVETGFESHHQTFDDLRAQIDQTIARNQSAMNVDEKRTCTFVRIELPKDAPAEVEQQAHAAINKIYAAFEHETGLFEVNIAERATAIAKDLNVKVKITAFKSSVRSEFEPIFGDALFAIPDVGRVSPPTHTPSGWDLILLTQRVPAKHYTRDEVAAIVFPELRRRQFQLWMMEIARSLGVQVVVDPEHVLARLDAESR